MGKGGWRLSQWACLGLLTIEVLKSVAKPNHCHLRNRVALHYCIWLKPRLCPGICPDLPLAACFFVHCLSTFLFLAVRAKPASAPKAEVKAAAPVKAESSSEDSSDSSDSEPEKKKPTKVSAMSFLLPSPAKKKCRRTSGICLRGLSSSMFNICFFNLRLHGGLFPWQKVLRGHKGFRDHSLTLLLFVVRFLWGATSLPPKRETLKNSQWISAWPGIDTWGVRMRSVWVTKRQEGKD